MSTEYDQLEKLMQSHFKSVTDMLEMRKIYWDERIDKICNTVNEMKRHCEHQQDQCSIVFREFDRRLDQNTDDITKIKTVGSVVAFAWGALVTFGGHILRKLGG